MTIKRKFPRSSGVLMPLTTLYGPFGIGVMGKEAREFIDFLSDSGFHGWQILPIEHAGMCNSPYRCISTYAGEPMLIDPRMLLDMGLITESELSARTQGMNEAAVDYEVVREKQWEILRLAFSRISDKPYRNFNPFWLDEYALFISARHYFNNEAWFNWSHEGLRSHDLDALNEYRQKLSNDIEFHQFVQWLFDLQWNELRSYATKKGIAVIGDTPIYVSDDSVEVWSRRDLFNGDAEGNFDAIGGVPPDYFSPDGQRWGNPIYNWDLLKKENYKWWIDRLKGSLDRYDVVRLDHFRGFEQYWDIPGDAPTAKTGKWEDGPGIALFNVLEEALGDLSLSIIAEDLGIIDDRVEQLVKDSGFRGMRVLQFGFLGDDTNMPHNYAEETTAYTGTHDNTTLLAWFYELSEEDRKEALFYTGFDGDWTIGGANSPIIKQWIRTLFMTSSSLTVVPIQDMLGYGADTRTNIPGTSSGNWRFRIRKGVLEEIDKDFYIELHRTFQREDPVKSFKPKEKTTPP
ncbi:MAG: 4-alpha-glucanotransferase [Oscillospiraceae bacterium]|nr:4-alpha-glucanotransferase [Oscillospiraceae bacterium]